ncbi:MAG: acyl-CoA thioesterase, partial [Spirosomataceae bacterium]
AGAERMSELNKKLTSTLEINVRFSETDAMGVVWHGNYLKYFEDGREHFGREYGMPYLTVAGHGFFIPIVHTSLDFKASVYYGQKIKVVTEYVPVRTAKIVFNYKVINLTTDELAAEGTTTQVFISQETRQLELLIPPFYQAWKDTYFNK